MIDGETRQRISGFKIEKNKFNSICCSDRIRRSEDKSRRTSRRADGTHSSDTANSRWKNCTRNGSSRSAEDDAHRSPSAEANGNFLISSTDDDNWKTDHRIHSLRVVRLSLWNGQERVSEVERCFFLHRSIEEDVVTFRGDSNDSSSSPLLSFSICVRVRLVFVPFARRSAGGAGAEALGPR